jgi:hypothetical protein
MRGSRFPYGFLARRGASQCGESETALERLSVSVWFAVERHMLLYNFHSGRLPISGAWRFFVGALCSAILGSLLAVWLMSSEGRGLLSNARFGCLDFGKGGSLCASRSIEAPSRNADCTNFGRAGRLCFSGSAGEDRSQERTEPNVVGM